MGVAAPAKARKPSRHDGTAGSQPSEWARWLFAPREPGLRVAVRGGGGAWTASQKTGTQVRAAAGSSSQMLTGPLGQSNAATAAAAASSTWTKLATLSSATSSARAGPLGHRPVGEVPGARSVEQAVAQDHPLRQLGHRGLQLRYPGQARPQGHVLRRRIRAVLVAERDALGHDAPGSGGAGSVDQIAGADRPQPGVGRAVLPGEVGQLVQHHARARPPARRPSVPSRRRHRRRSGRPPRLAAPRRVPRCGSARSPGHPAGGAAARSAARPRRSLQPREHASGSPPCRDGGQHSLACSESRGRPRSRIFANTPCSAA